MSNILIVDDEQSYRQLLTLVFESDGHTVRTASNGREALSVIQADGVDVVISDVKMPDMDGIEMLRGVRDTQPDLLPWKHPMLKAAHDLVKGHGWTGGFRSKSVYCVAVTAK